VKPTELAPPGSSPGSGELVDCFPASRGVPLIGLLAFGCAVAFWTGSETCCLFSSVLFVPFPGSVKNPSFLLTHDTPFSTVTIGPLEEQTSDLFSLLSSSEDTRQRVLPAGDVVPLDFGPVSPGSIGMRLLFFSFSHGIFPPSPLFFPSSQISPFPLSGSTGSFPLCSVPASDRVQMIRVALPFFVFF